MAGGRGMRDMSLYVCAVLLAAWWPQLRINGHQYRGGLTVGEVMRAICAGFPNGKEPQVRPAPCTPHPAPHPSSMHVHMYGTWRLHLPPWLMHRP